MPATKKYYPFIQKTKLYDKAKGNASKIEKN